MSVVFLHMGKVVLKRKEPSIRLCLTKCHVDIFADFTSEFFNPLFSQCKYLYFTLDTVNLL